VSSRPKSFLIIQTAFIGDVILATGLIEKLRKSYPDSGIDFLLRKGNESLLTGHPLLREVIVWDKELSKLLNLFKLIFYVRSKRYDAVINAQRFMSSGMITAFSGAHIKVGFNKNPWSFLFSHRIKHEFEVNLHEVDRNHRLITFFTDEKRELPRLYPSVNDMERVKPLKMSSYICIAPASVWFTKQYPAAKWISFLDAIALHSPRIYLLGSAEDWRFCEEIKNSTRNKQVENIAGKLGLLESAALMKDAVMNFVNDSAPLHLASAIDAPVTAIYCSTVPAFGFGPLSSISHIIETKEPLGCRPCGVHGNRQCPAGHFKCATAIGIDQLQNCLMV